MKVDQTLAVRNQSKRQSLILLAHEVKGNNCQLLILEVSMQS